MAGYGGARGRKKLTKKKKVIERFKNIHPSYRFNSQFN